MKNCCDKEKETNTNINMCFDPCHKDKGFIIRLFIDDCSGVPVYPVTSFDAVIVKIKDLPEWLRNCVSNGCEKEEATLSEVIECLGASGGDGCKVIVSGRVEKLDDGDYILHLIYNDGSPVDINLGELGDLSTNGRDYLITAFEYDADNHKLVITQNDGDGENFVDVAIPIAPIIPGYYYSNERYTSGTNFPNYNDERIKYIGVDLPEDTKPTLEYPFIYSVVTEKNYSLVKQYIFPSKGYKFLVSSGSHTQNDNGTTHFYPDGKLACFYLNNNDDVELLAFQSFLVGDVNPNQMSNYLSDLLLNNYGDALTNENIGYNFLNSGYGYTVPENPTNIPSDYKTNTNEYARNLAKIINDEISVNEYTIKNVSTTRVNGESSNEENTSEGFPKFSFVDVPDPSNSNLLLTVSTLVSDNDYVNYVYNPLFYLQVQKTADSPKEFVKNGEISYSPTYGNNVDDLLIKLYHCTDDSEHDPFYDPNYDSQTSPDNPCQLIAELIKYNEGGNADYNKTEFVVDVNGTYYNLEIKSNYRLTVNHIPINNGNLLSALINNSLGRTEEDIDINNDGLLDGNDLNLVINAILAKKNTYANAFEYGTKGPNLTTYHTLAVQFVQSTQNNFIDLTIEEDDDKYFVKVKNGVELNTNSLLFSINLSGNDTFTVADSSHQELVKLYDTNSNIQVSTNIIRDSVKPEVAYVVITSNVQGSPIVISSSNPDRTLFAFLTTGNSEIAIGAAGQTQKLKKLSDEYNFLWAFRHNTTLYSDTDLQLISNSRNSSNLYILPYNSIFTLNLNPSVVSRLPEIYYYGESSISDRISDRMHVAEKKQSNNEYTSIYWDDSVTKPDDMSAIPNITLYDFASWHNSSLLPYLFGYLLAHCFSATKSVYSKDEKAINKFYVNNSGWANRYSKYNFDVQYSNIKISGKIGNLEKGEDDDVINCVGIFVFNIKDGDFEMDCTAKLKIGSFTHYKDSSNDKEYGIAVRNESATHKMFNLMMPKVEVLEMKAICTYIDGNNDAQTDSIIVSE